MKKIILLSAVVAMMMGVTSCSTVSNTATTANVDTELLNRSTADLSVSNKRISYMFEPTNQHRRAGLKSMKAAAVTAALEANGNAALLVAPQFEIKETKGFFGSRKVKYIKVSGYPASYHNVHPTTKAEAETVNLLEYPAVQVIK